MGIYRKALFSVPSWSGTSPLIAVLLCTVNVIAVYIIVVLCNKTSFWVIIWVSDMNDMEGMAMKVNWMSAVESTNRWKHLLNSFLIGNGYHLHTWARGCWWVAVGVQVTNIVLFVKLFRFGLRRKGGTLVWESPSKLKLMKCRQSRHCPGVLGFAFGSSAGGVGSSKRRSWTLIQVIW